MSSKKAIKTEEHIKLAIFLTTQLTPEELSLLCEAYDDGRIRDMFEEVLLPYDQKNFPEKYHSNEEKGKSFGDMLREAIESSKSDTDQKS